MPLIKLGAGIIDIRGRLAGNIFKRDGTGLHMTAKSRYVRKPKTQKQIDQNNWYCAIKRAERTSPIPPESPLEEPRRPAVGIYSMDYMMAYRQWCEGTPVPVGVYYTGIGGLKPKAWFQIWYPNHALEEELINAWTLDYVNTNWQSLGFTWGMSNFEVAAVVNKYYDFYLLQKNEPPLLAKEHAIQLFDRAVRSNRMKATRVSQPKGWRFDGEVMGINVLLAALAGMAAYVISTSVYQTYLGSVRFQKRRVIIEMADTLAFGSLLGRPSPNMLDFIFVGPPAFPSFQMDYGRSPGDLNEVWFDPDLSISEVDQHFGYHWTYTWSQIKTRWCREGHLISEGVYRMAADAATLEYFSIPTGYRYPTSDFYDYNTKLFEYWREWPEEGPRL